MAIGTGSGVEVYGTTGALDDTSTALVLDGNISVAADITAWTNTDDAINANLILLWQYPSGTIDGKIDIHVRPINIDGTTDPLAPTTTNPSGYVGSFNISTAQVATTDTVYQKVISFVPWSMKTSQEYEFYLINNTGVSMSANWDLDIVPKAYNAQA